MDKKQIIEAIKTSENKKIIIKSPFRLKIIEEKEVEFDNETREEAERIIRENPSFFDGKIISVREYKIDNDTLTLKTFPTSFKYFLLTRKKLTSTPILPLTVGALTYTEEQGTKYYLFGLKRKENLLGNLIHCIPGGFVEDLNFEQTLRKELKEESGKEFNNLEMKMMGFVYLSDQSNYCLCYNMKIEDTEKFLKLDNRKSEEFKQIRVIPENKITEFLQKPNSFFYSKEELKINELEHTILSLYFS